MYQLVLLIIVVVILYAVIKLFVQSPSARKIMILIIIGLLALYLVRYLIALVVLALIIVGFFIFKKMK